MPSPTTSAELHLQRLSLLYVFACQFDYVPLPVALPRGSSAASIIGAIFLFWWFLLGVAGKVSLRLGSGTLLTMMTIPAWEVLTILWSTAPHLSANQAVTTLLLVCSSIAVSDSQNDDLTRIATTISLSSSVSSILLLFNQSDVHGIDDRFTYLDIDPNILSFHLCIGLASSVYLVTPGLSERLWIPHLVSIALQISAITLTGSRTGVGAMLVIGTVGFLKQRLSLRTTLRFSVLFLTVLATIQRVEAAGLIPERILIWIQDPVLNDQRSLIISAFKETQSAWMLTGVGAGADAAYLESTHNLPRVAHGFLWSVWVQLGVVGLLLWSALIIRILHKIIQVQDRHFFILSLIPVTAYFFTLGPYHSNLLWVIIGVILGKKDNSSTRRDVRNVESTTAS